jgi:hypothetical protein
MTIITNVTIKRMNGNHIYPNKIIKLVGSAKINGINPFNRSVVEVHRVGDMLCDNQVDYLCKCKDLYEVTITA